jgi:hypothetical protein
MPPYQSTPQRITATKTIHCELGSEGKRFFILSLLILILVFPFPAHAQTTSGEVLFQADFEDARLPSELHLSDHWSITQTTLEGGTVVQVLQGVAFRSTEVMILPSATAWGNYALELRMRLSGTGDFTLSTRSDPGNPDCPTGFFLTVSVIRNFNRLGTISQGCGARWLDKGDDTHLPLGRWINLRLETIDDGAFVYVDGQLILSGQADVPAQGVAMLVLQDDMRIEIDSLTVTHLRPPLTVTRYQEEPEAIIAELRERGLVPEGGSLLFEEPYAYFTGVTNGFVPLAPQRHIRNLVMAGELTFTSTAIDKPEVCWLGARMVRHERGTASLRVGFVNDGRVTVNDLDEQPVSVFANRRMDFTQPHHVLILAFGESVSVFVDGELVIDALPVTDRSGFFGIGLVGQELSSRCDGQNIWVYEFD